MDEFRLSELAPFASCTVVRTEECAARKRLEGLGIVEGARMTRLFSAPCGDPRAYSVRGAAAAIRNSDAAHVIVRGES